MPTLLVLGATSDIALATARRFAEHGHDIVLAARKPEALTNHAADIRIRYRVSVNVLPYDALDYASHPRLVAALNPMPDTVLFCVGLLGKQPESQADFAAARRVIESNYLAAVSILEPIAAAMERSGKGTIIGVSSVAGERGRMTNYIYGSAKAGLTAYLSGLRNRLFHAGGHVITVKPGFVRTAMTEGMDLPARLTAEPERVAADIFRAYEKRRNVVYSKPVWRSIMLIIRGIPEAIFKRLKL